jgi:hypothetical protein
LAIRQPQEERGDALAEYLFTLGPDYPKVAPAAEAIHPPPPLSSPTRRANDIDKKREEYMTPRAISVQYKTIAYELLVERFPMAGKSDLRVLHNRYNGAYTPTYFDLRADLALPQPRYNRLKKARPIRHRLLHIGDAALRTEVTWVDLFVEQEDAELKAFKKEKQRLADEKLALELADKDDERNGRFLACGCCFGDFPARKIVQCADGHLFCIEWVRCCVVRAALKAADACAPSSKAGSGTARSTCRAWTRTAAARRWRPTTSCAGSSRRRPLTSLRTSASRRRSRMPASPTSSPAPFATLGTAATMRTSVSSTATMRCVRRLGQRKRRLSVAEGLQENKLSAVPQG